MKTLLSTCALALGVVAFVGTTLAEPAGSKRKYPNLFKGALPYSGVTLQGGEPPKAKAPPPHGVSYLTWPGFLPHSDGSQEIFVQLTGAPDYKVKQKGRHVYVTFKKVRIYLRNNLRRVVTKHFPGAVASFRMRRRGRSGARLSVVLSKNVAPTVDVKTQGAYHYLVLRFPAS